ncbi:hypothetical protein BDD14_1800 [Edaphobacter modestus]|uniref:Uncharacterized protein n=1 Tax=Edaphobacter modestus TaxID=388466 RepID=A0A4Q7YTS5_9BACT|nr:hypothetical protein BDD14_1800 [Edaphobacter modestus]
MGRCIGRLINGTRCIHEARIGANYCSVHGPMRAGTINLMRGTTVKKSVKKAVKKASKKAAKKR